MVHVQCLWITCYEFVLSIYKPASQAECPDATTTPSRTESKVIAHPLKFQRMLCSLFAVIEQQLAINCRPANMRTYLWTGHVRVAHKTFPLSLLQLLPCTLPGLESRRRSNGLFGRSTITRRTAARHDEWDGDKRGQGP